jgi:phosphoesterase RecJ-like protein
MNERDHALFREIVERGERFLLVTHMNPDGDALGSELGLARFLLARGKQVRILNHDPAPPVLAFLDRGDVAVEIHDPAIHDASTVADHDRIVLLDNSAPDRLGRLEPALREAASRVLCIDHHPTRGTVWGDLILDVGSSATAAMIHELVVAAGWMPDPAAAEALYVGIATDTGFFRYNSTTSRALRIAADLMDAGVDPAACYRRIYERNSAEHTKILGRVLSDLVLGADGRLVSVRIPRSLAGVDTELDVGEMATPLLAIDGVRVVALFRELDDDRVKVSLRSKGSLDVHALAATFGGGGHRNASGIVTGGSLEEVAGRVLAGAEALLETAEDDR